MQTIWKTTARLTVCALMIAFLAACGNSNSNNSPAQQQASAEDNAQTAGEQSGGQSADNASGNDANEESAASVRTLTDPLGHEVTVPADPQRIIATYLEDHLLTLGVKPVAQWAIQDSPMLYLQNELQGVPYVPWDLPFEAVTSHAPDLIVIGAESTIADGKYDSYAKIAPTYTLGDAVNDNWREALLKVGEVLGKDEQAQAALAEYDRVAADARAQLEAAYDAPPSVAALWYFGKDSFWAASEDLVSGVVLYEELGLAVPELIKTISAGEGGNWKPVSMEALAELDADHIFLVNSTTEPPQEPIWLQVKAVKAGNVHVYGPETSWLYSGNIANRQVIEDVLESLIR